MPEIFWHDRVGILSVDIHPVMTKNNCYRIVTASMQREIRVWEVAFELSTKKKVEALSVNFRANLPGHDSTVNCVRFAPVVEGMCLFPSDTSEPLLASGDCNGKISIWREMPDHSIPPPAAEDLPPNKEAWIRQRTFYHDTDVVALAWDSTGHMLASISADESLFVHEMKSGKRIVSKRSVVSKF